MSRLHLSNWDKSLGKKSNHSVATRFLRSRPEKEAELMGNCYESKMRLRQDWKKERSQYAFEVAIGMAWSKETTLS